MVEKSAGFDKSTIYGGNDWPLDEDVERIDIQASRLLISRPSHANPPPAPLRTTPMLDAIPSDAPTCPVEDQDGIPHTLLEAHLAWENARQRNLEIRRRFQEGREKGILLRSAAMLPSWQS
jgi:hypothetical protein